MGVVLVALISIYISLILHYAKNETNLQSVNAILKRKNEVLVSGLSSVAAVCNNSAEGLVDMSYTIQEQGKIDMRLWNFDKSSMWICKAVYDAIVKHCNKEKAIRVSYVKLVENDKNDTICTVGFCNDSDSHPTVYNRQRKINSERAYYDAYLFKRNSSDIAILFDKDEINDKFEFHDRTNEKNKYEQYIGVPIFCNNNKMIGVLQVVSLANNQISNNRDDLMLVAKRIVKPFSTLAILLFKIEKAICSFSNK